MAAGPRAAGGARPGQLPRRGLRARPPPGAGSLPPPGERRRDRHLGVSACSSQRCEPRFPLGSLKKQRGVGQARAPLSFPSPPLRSLPPHRRRGGESERRSRPRGLRALPYPAPAPPPPGSAAAPSQARRGTAQAAGGDAALLGHVVPRPCSPAGTEPRPGFFLQPPPRLRFGGASPMWGCCWVARGKIGLGAVTSRCVALMGTVPWDASRRTLPFSRSCFTRKGSASPADGNAR